MNCRSCEFSAAAACCDTWYTPTCDVMTLVALVFPLFGFALVAREFYRGFVIGSWVDKHELTMQLGPRLAFWLSVFTFALYSVLAMTIWVGLQRGVDDILWQCEQLFAIILTYLGIYFGAFVIFIARRPIADFTGRAVRRTLEDRAVIRRISGPHCPPPYADPLDNYRAGVHGAVTELTIILKTAIINQCHVYHDGRDYFIKRFWYLVACLIFWSRWADEGASRKLFDDATRKTLRDHMFAGKVARVLRDVGVIIEPGQTNALDDDMRGRIWRQMLAHARVKMKDAKGKPIDALEPICFPDFVKVVDKIIPRELSGVCCDEAGCLSPPPGKSVLDLLGQIDFVWARRVRGARVIDDVTVSQEAQFTTSEDPGSTLSRQTAETSRESGEAARQKHERALQIDKALCDLEHIALRLSRSLYGV